MAFTYLLEHALPVSVASIVVYFVGSAIYNLYFSPLAKYPGPFLAKISGLPSFYYACSGYRHIWVWRCHQIYGDKVRVHPNELVVNTVSGYRAVYNLKANIKRANFYNAYPKKADAPSTINTIDNQAHARKRRILNSAFSERAVRSAETFIIKHVNRWIELILQDVKDWSSPQDMAKLTDALIFDVLGDLAFGKSFDIKEPGDNPFRVIPGAIHEFLAFMYPIARSPILDFFVWLKPRGLDALFQAITPANIKHYQAFLVEQVEARSREEELLHKSGSEGQRVREDMFHFLFNAKDPQTGNAALTREEMEEEANLLVIAGSDTTVNTLSGLFFYVTRFPQVYKKLVQEIRQNFNSLEEIVGGPKLHSCVYMRACIDEALRLCPAVASELPREVLPGGQEVDGDHLPEGVRVGTSVWSLHHNEEHFPDAAVYRPERWIVDEKTGMTEELVAYTKSCFYPFSAGPGNCVGKNLAMLEMMVVVARVFYQMDIKAAPGSDLGGGNPKLGWGRRNRMEYQMHDTFVSQRKGPMVQFKRREY